MIVAARERGIEVVGELELAWRLLPNEFIAVTGTNGKTTTVELLGAIYRAAGAPVAVAGNVGTPLSSLVGQLEPAATVVCETSSFQLEDASAFAPECAVLLNLERGPPRPPRQLRGLPRRQAPHLRAPGRGRPGRAARRLRLRAPACPRAPLRGAGQRAHGCVERSELRLRGAHNLENAMAAAAAALAHGIELEAVRRGAAHVPGRGAPARGGGRARRRAVRERLEGDQRGRPRGAGSRRSTAACTLIARRQPQGRRLHAVCARR